MNSKDAWDVSGTVLSTLQALIQPTQYSQVDGVILMPVLYKVRPKPGEVRFLPKIIEQNQQRWNLNGDE